MREKIGTLLFTAMFAAAFAGLAWITVAGK
jgi:hypothetical protein